MTVPSSIQSESEILGQTVVVIGVPALAVHFMTNTALTGVTYDIDGGQQFVDA